MKIDFNYAPKQELYRILNDIAFMLRNEKDYLKISFSITHMFLNELLEFSETCKGRSFNFKEHKYLEEMIEELIKMKNEK